MILPEDLKQLLRAFNEHGVEYLVVGGYAVGLTTWSKTNFIPADCATSPT